MPRSGNLGPAGGGGGDALAEPFGALAVGGIGLDIGGHLASLGHEAGEAAEAVGALVVLGQVREADP